jgi:serine/threonine-protein kinase RsbW
MVTFDLATHGRVHPMPEQQSGEICRVDSILESTLDSVDTAETETLKVAEEVGFEEEELHKIGMAVRECMVNAVVHGNRYNARKKVHFRVLRGNDHMTVVVRDEGEGFEWQSLPDPLAEENLLRQSGRGLLLIRAFMDDTQIQQLNPKGTEVKMMKYLAKAS